MAEEATVRMKCPSCGTLGRGKASYLYRDIRCPKCGNTVRFAPVSSHEGAGSGQAQAQPAGAPPKDAGTTQASEVPHAVPMAKNAARVFDTGSTIGASVAGGGLFVLALSPLFKWIKFGAGGVTGIAGDGKIILGVSVLAIAAYAVAVATRKWLTPILLAVQAWGTLAVFWMGGLIWKVSSILSSPDVQGNPFAALFATQISPGAGLYLGLIGGIAVAGALGFLVVRRLLCVGSLKRYYVTQGVACVIGILLALSVGPDRPESKATTDKGDSRAPSIFRSSDTWQDAPSIAVGESRTFGRLDVTPLGTWKSPVAYKVAVGDDVRKHENPVLLLALRVQNTSEGEVFAPAPAFSDAYEVAEVVDNFGNHSLGSGICQFSDWPANDQVGQEPEKLPPGGSAVLVFVVAKLENENASGFTWRVKLFVDNKFTTQRLLVSAPANAIHAALPKNNAQAVSEGTLHGTVTSGAKTELDPKPEVREKTDYIKLVHLYGLKAKYYTPVLDERVPGVEFKLRNTGQRTLSKVKVTVYFRDAGGNVIAEKDYHPVLLSEFSMGPSKPLKPGYVWQIERGKFYQAKDIPTEWEEGNVQARVTEVDFATPKDVKMEGLDSPEKQAYLAHLDLYDFQSRYYTTVLDERVPGVEFKLKNRGSRTLRSVEVTVFFKDGSGRVISEEDYHPVLMSDSSFTPGKPLKPGYIWQMERGKFYQAPLVPDEWQQGSAEAKITALEFAD
jgi:DNA-directed RNA polymerase subunit RPC12/RpoP